VISLRWYGQSAFLLREQRGAAVFIDPFGDLASATGGRFRFDYPVFDEVEAGLLLITHEHIDHNAAERIAGEPQLIRSTAGRFATPLGEVVAIASEHDSAAGTERGPNTIFVFPFAGLTVCHFGDFGQAALRPEQRAAIGQVDLLLLPVGGGATIDGGAAAEIVTQLSPHLVVPMHYRTGAIDFLEPLDAFLDAVGDRRVVHHEASELELDRSGEPRVVIPAVPGA
jgi:L-ascorbate metabolism protein UlaG (beta-lactamase superfamily)